MEKKCARQNKNLKDACKYILKVNKMINGMIEAKYFFNKLKEKDKKKSLKKIIIKYGKSKDNLCPLISFTSFFNFPYLLVKSASSKC